MSSICVITPTISRPTLKRALLSADLAPNDDWIVFGDGAQPEAKAVVNELRKDRPYLHYIESSRSFGNNGNALRDIAMTISDKDYFLFLDDDDIFLPGAIETIRNRMRDCPVIFKMKHPINGVIWKNMIITPGNVGGSMLCLPNDASKRAIWSRYRNHGSDINFISETLPMWDNYEWADNVIIEVSPNELYDSIL